MKPLGPPAFSGGWIPAVKRVGEAGEEDGVGAGEGTGDVRREEPSSWNLADLSHQQ